MIRLAMSGFLGDQSDVVLTTEVTLADEDTNPIPVDGVE